MQLKKLSIVLKVSIPDKRTTRKQLDFKKELNNNDIIAYCFDFKSGSYAEPLRKRCNYASLLYVNRTQIELNLYGQRGGYSYR